MHECPIQVKNCMTSVKITVIGGLNFRTQQLAEAKLRLELIVLGRLINTYQELLTLAYELARILTCSHLL